jgi:glycosyltransferase involved in cell wall biosynthesis
LEQPLTVKNAPIKSRLKPLRILFVLNFEWDARLGAVRVYIDLADEWRSAGHSVERFSLSEAFPKAGKSPAGFAIRQVLFSYKAAAFIKKNAGRFDVVDALIGFLPVSKQKLGFRGLIVARSVGLFRLYQRFEKSAAKRWPRRSRGKLLGRMLYTFTQRWFMSACDESVRQADLVNLPNENEADCVRQEIGSMRPIIVQPYGLRDEQRRALREAAAPADVRLAGKKICFVGMWSRRKGAYDWPGIIQRVRQEIPDACFWFLGTMVDSSTIREELALASFDGIEMISEYSPVDLPALLADCAVGAFPTYVEGFGLAVLEQLAAGIPTVAFDVPGPRDILRADLPELLVPSGDLEAFAREICKILKLRPAAYEELSQRSAKTATRFTWSNIGKETLDAYRDKLRSIEAGPLLFVQPFGLSSAGGGSRILRALLKNAPMEWHSLCCSPGRPERSANETHLPSRPSWGKIETSRLARLPKMTMSIFASRFRRRLLEFCRARNVRAIHAIPHVGLDFVHAQAVAEELGLPFYLQVHDDFAFSSTGQVSPQKAHAAMQSAWRDAALRFVICDRLGKEYCRRYGVRDYTVVTDGLERVASAPTVRAQDELRIYFMGLFHLEYEENVRVFCAALERLRALRPSVRASITLRCGSLRPSVIATARDMIRVLPFGTENDVQRDLEHADLLYLPLPFGAKFEPLVRFSLSTKLVTYLGSGIPILYHGPQTSVAYELLAEHSAALFHLSLDVDPLTGMLCRVCDQRGSTAEVSANALELARNRFMLQDQRERFWRAVTRTLEKNAVAANSSPSLTAAR